MLVELELVTWSGFAAHLIAMKKADLLSVRTGVGVRGAGSFASWKRKGDVVDAIDEVEERSSPRERKEIRFPATIRRLVQGCKGVWPCSVLLNSSYLI